MGKLELAMSKFSNHKLGGISFCFRKKKGVQDSNSITFVIDQESRSKECAFEMMRASKKYEKNSLFGGHWEKPCLKYRVVINEKNTWFMIYKCVLLLCLSPLWYPALLVRVLLLWRDTWLQQLLQEKTSNWGWLTVRRLQSIINMSGSIGTCGQTGASKASI